MTKLPKSLSIALWFVGTMWLVGLLGYLTGQGIDVIVAIFIMGLIAAAMEWRS